MSDGRMHGSLVAFEGVTIVLYEYSMEHTTSR
jgi:hypothetical protein